MNSHSSNSRTVGTTAACSHLLCFISLYDQGRSVAVPCDETGNVDMNSLTEGLRITYLGARAMVGRDYFCPTVQIAH